MQKICNLFNSNLQWILQNIGQIPKIFKIQCIFGLLIQDIAKKMFHSMQYLIKILNLKEFYNLKNIFMKSSLSKWIYNNLKIVCYELHAYRNVKIIFIFIWKMSFLSFTQPSSSKHIFIFENMRFMRITQLSLTLLFKKFKNRSNVIQAGWAA